VTPSVPTPAPEQKLRVAIILLAVMLVGCTVDAIAKANMDSEARFGHDLVARVKEMSPRAGVTCWYAMANISSGEFISAMSCIPTSQIHR